MTTAHKGFFDEFENLRKAEERLGISGGYETRGRGRKPSRKRQLEQYKSLRRKALALIADRYILDPAGQDLYVQTGSGFRIAGKFRIHPDFIDHDHTLRDLNNLEDLRRKLAELKSFVAALKKKKR